MIGIRAVKWIRGVGIAHDGDIDRASAGWVLDPYPVACRNGVERGRRKFIARVRRGKG